MRFRTANTGDESLRQLPRPQTALLPNCRRKKKTALAVERSLHIKCTHHNSTPDRVRKPRSHHALKHAAGAEALSHHALKHAAGAEALSHRALKHAAGAEALSHRALKHAVGAEALSHRALKAKASLSG